MAEEQHTKEQHYVPRVLLQGFSTDSRFLYEYNIKADRAIKTPVDIESVCREKYLYELRNEQGEIVNLNYLEKVLCQIEGKFADFRRNLLKKAVFKENYQTASFLTTEEKEFWLFFTALQIARNPTSLQGIKEFILKEMPGDYSDQEAQNLAAKICLPFFSTPDRWELNMLTFVISILKDKALTVGYTETDDLFTSDHAAYGSKNPDEMLPQFQRLWFPIASNCALIFSDPELIGPAGRNRLIPLDEDDIRNMNKGIAYIATRMVLSKHPFSDADLKLIREAKRERDQDKMKKQDLAE